jgi:hypothetical protein
MAQKAKQQSKLLELLLPQTLDVGGMKTMELPAS